MPKTSEGLLLFREISGGLEVLLVHPGGPFWSKKDDGAWSIPKGELGRGSLRRRGASSRRRPELLRQAKPSGGKIVHAWAIRRDFDPQLLRSNIALLEWPPKSGRMQEFPEVDRAEWFVMDIANRRS